MGNLALEWHYPLINEQLNQAIWDLAGRDKEVTESKNQQQGINVNIVFGLAGGTGSGMFVDIAYIIRAIFDELGNQGQFCHITGIGVLPQAFRKVSSKNLYANTGAALEELGVLMAQGNFTMRYPGGRLVKSPDAPFQLF